ncbi:MAG TPA: citramalate synthase [Polyangia bacterium]|jgi:2-isopropylmalate synthase
MKPATPEAEAPLRHPAEPPGSAVVRVYDTTLRDGTQGEGVSLSCTDKLRIARRLDALGVAFVEGGWPGSNPKDAEFFRRARELPWEHSLLTAFGATRRAGVAPGEDPSLRALLEAGAAVCTIFGKSHTLHVTEVLRTTHDENLRMIEESVAWLRAAGVRLVYDAEHFFDGWRADPGYAVETLRAAVRGGAEVLTLCDTNGGSLPWQIEEAIGAVRAALPTPLGIHTHDDAGCAVANAIAAVRAGARHVQGTINGYGERCGNASLSALIPTLELKLGLRCLPEGALRHLTALSTFVAEVANVSPDDQHPYVGRSAFAHKGGVHVAAMRRNKASYQHIDPALVGNESRVVLSELSGRGNLLSKAEELGLDVHDDVHREVLARIKEDEFRGASFEAAEASVALMLRRSAPGYEAPFRLLDYKVMVGQRADDDTFAEATIKIAIGAQVLHTAAEGSGPVHALDAALRKALVPVYPAVARIQLVDYKVRILDGKEGTRATTRVLLDSRDGERSWSTVGASTNIIEASWRALADSIEYGLWAAADEPGTPEAA